MELTTKARYGVMALVDLCLHAGQGAVTLPDIARRQNLSQTYLGQLFARLRRAGLIIASRGPQGGYKLARPAEAITIGAIWEAVDENVQATACQNSAGCLGRSARCATHDLWSELEVHIDQFVRSITLADVAFDRVKGRAAAMAKGPSAASIGVGCVTAGRLRAHEQTVSAPL